MLKEYQPLVFVVVLFFVLFFMRGGLVDLPAKVWSLLRPARVGRGGNA